MNFEIYLCHQGDNVDLRQLYCHLKACGDGGIDVKSERNISPKARYFRAFAESVVGEDDRRQTLYENLSTVLR